jgi:hypothetical protein
MKHKDNKWLNYCFLCKEGYYSMNDLNRHFKTKKHIRMQLLHLKAVSGMGKSK